MVQERQQHRAGARSQGGGQGIAAAASTAAPHGHGAPAGDPEVVKRSCDQIEPLLSLISQILFFISPNSWLALRNLI